MQSNEKSTNILRNKLCKDDSNSNSDRLYQEFLLVEKRAYEIWLPLLGHDKGSHSGPNHIKGVESQICAVLEKIKGVDLTSVESFILLSAVMFHDVGKIISKTMQRKLTQKKDLQSSAIFELYKLDYKPKASNKPHHGLVSALYLMSAYPEFGFSDKGIVECIAIVCASHKLGAAKKLQERHELGDKFLDQYGKIRISWLCALITLGDELDNSYHRAAPEWIDTPNNKSNDKGRLRAQLSGCEVNLEGKLLVVHLHKEFYKDLLYSKKIKDESLYRIWNDLTIKREMLIFWHETFRQMHIELLDVAVNINGHLLGLRTNVEKFENNKIYIYVLHISRADKQRCAITKNISKGIFRVENKNSFSLEVHIERNKIKEALVYIQDKLNNTKWYIKLESFQLVVEPIIRQIKIDRLLDAAVKLRFNSFGNTAFPWETLATEAGIETENEVKLIFHRLLMLSIIYFPLNDDNKPDKNPITKPLRRLGPVISKDRKKKLSFTELDGEWAINIIGDIKNEFETSEFVQDVKKLIYKFHTWVAKILSALDIPDVIIGQGEDKKTTKDIFECIQITNNNVLSYLLDETKQYEGIYFPKSKSWLYKEDACPNIGINLVITGPAGVGKSTLAMEIVAKGIKKNYSEDGTIPVSAYYSLEQPIESIREIACGLKIDEKNILEFEPKFNPFDRNILRKPNYVSSYNYSLKNLSGDNAKGPILFLPKLAPRTYGNVISEERLFWFRYKQISRLLEADRDYCLHANENKFSLNTIVVDNLNSFSRNPLARQQVHQLFKLNSWYGILGIYIIENNPAEEFRVFQTEVEFLADIVIKLDWVATDYQFKVIEVVKSRCQRNVLGKHPFKIRRSEANKSTIDRSKRLNITETSLYGLEIFPSIHTQVSRSEKKPETTEGINSTYSNFSTNGELNNLVHKDSEDRKDIKQYKDKEDDTGIDNDAFIILQGKVGGHKLAIGMSYLHAKNNEKCAIVINIGQPINYYDVADNYKWWKRKNIKRDIHNNLQLNWDKCQKVNIDLYSPYEPKIDKKGVNLKENIGSIFVLNFHAGFLLPEEFLQIIKLFIDDVGGNKRISRILFNSTAHMPERYPLLDKNPLLLHALVKILKQERISLMIIGVEGMGRGERVMGLAAMADLRVTVHHLGDERLPSVYIEKLDRKKDDISNATIISSDNVTGKDYEKKYRILAVDRSRTGGQKFVINKIEALERKKRVTP